MGGEFRIVLIWCVLASVLCFSGFTLAVDRITTGERIRDGESIISSRNRFELGFFSSGSSSFRYVGIWYLGSNISADSAVWVANRGQPISGNGGVLTIGSDGNLLVLDGNNATVWSSNVTVVSSNSTAVLRDDGNLILSTNESSGSRGSLYESFNNPTDTFLPEMRVRVGPGESRVFTSWRSNTDPSPGNYTMGIDPRGSPQVVIWEGANRHWRSGHWNGLSFIGVANLRSIYTYGFRLNREGADLNFQYAPQNSTEIVKFRLTWEGQERQEHWDNGQRQWEILQLEPAGECDRYDVCGQFAICNQRDTSRCTCLDGFQPMNDDEWSRGNWSGGCIRRRELQCGRTNGEADGFLRLENVKLPDFVDVFGEEDAAGCRRRCLQNCSCVAYADVNGINCMMWNQELVDVQQFQEGGQTLYLRVAHSELGGRNHLTRNLVIIFVSIAAFLLCISCWVIWRRRRKVKETGTEPPKVGPNGEFSMDFSGNVDYCPDIPQAPGTDLVMPSFSHVAAATDNFSHRNKLGDGGFGEVFKGTLPCGQQVAVKRLSVKSTQGLEEFKNEITVIAKLQHRNLVKLLGCCVEGEEKMLLYEYMPNRSLDSFIFDKEKKSLLDWSKRFNIIEGIARGLLYLHRDSRLRIIHRDLKVSNILLDEEMNPKISDFGMARIFGGNQNEENTMRVVGTYGYMAPEYAMEGLFSIKSDVYSFGVLLLEIITGRRNISFRATDNSNIIGYAWDLFHKGRAMELTDPSVLSSCPKDQVLRCIHVGILCVQDNANNRPDMAAVVLMLESDKATLPMPKQPTVTSLRHLHDEITNDTQDDVSSNNVTISTIIGR